MSSRSPYVISGYVWLLSGVLLICYALLGLFGYKIPGIEELANFLAGVNGYYIYAAAFIAIFVEGVYLVGNIFPGSTILIILTLSAQMQSTSMFFFTIVSIYIGWTLAGIFNVALIKMVRHKLTMDGESNRNPNTVSQKWITWFPAFRSNYEVAQIIEGNSVGAVIISSSKIKLITSFFMMVILYALSYFVDVSTATNTEGFVSLAVIAVICLFVGSGKVRKAASNV